jgi:hypothetical protein
MMLFAGLSAAQLFRPTRARAMGILRKLSGIVVLGGAAAVLATQSATFLGIDDLSWQAVSHTLSWRSSLTVEGGSEFTPTPITSLAGVPMAVITVLFRPFPWEAHNLKLFFQGLEGVFLLTLTVAAWPRLRGIPRFVRRNPYVLFVMVYSSAFIVAFSGFGNFGVLARQRVLMLPFFLVLLALPKKDQALAHASHEREPHDVRR